MRSEKEGKKLLPKHSPLRSAGCVAELVTTSATSWVTAHAVPYYSNATERDAGLDRQLLGETNGALSTTAFGRESGCCGRESGGLKLGRGA